MLMNRWTFAAVSVVLMSASVLSARQAPPAKASPQLPTAIESAFKQAYPKATIKAVTREKYAGQDAYEVESIDGGKTRDLIYRLDGTVAVLEEQITAADLPAPVAAALKADYPKATVTRYERSIDNGVTSYEIQLKGAKVGSAEYLPDGKRK